MAELRTHDPDSDAPSAVPRLAEGTDLMGEYQGSGFEEAPYLVRRPDGQVVYLSRLLYLVAQAADGRRDFGRIAERTSRGFGRRLSADNVRFLVEEKLRPMGVVAPAEGETVEPPRLKTALLGLKYRLGVVPAGLAGPIAAPFLPLFWPPVVVAVLGGLLLFDGWLFLHGVLRGASEVIYQPWLLLAFSAVEMLSMAWHECGHATACRYGGAKPGVVGVGIYVVWFVFYSDVTDSYRLDRRGRLRTDLGGVYFDAIFALVLAGAYFLTGFEPLLVLILFTQLAALDELSPFLRLDGYYVLSDLTGVPDLFGIIKPVLKNAVPDPFGVVRPVLDLLPGEGTDRDLKALKPWVSRVVVAWVLSSVPLLLLGLVTLVIYGPWVLLTTWGSLLAQYAELSGALEGGRISEGILPLVNIATLVVPEVGGILLFALASKRFGVAAWRQWRKLRARP